MKTKFTNSELSHVWANQTQTHGKGSNMFFEYESIYSYGYHFTIAKHVINKDGQKCIFLNDKSYSNTTAKHQLLVWRAIPENVPFFRVKSFYTNIDHALTCHLENIKYFIDNAEKTQKLSISARKYKIGYLNQTKNNIDILQKYLAFFDITNILIEYPTIQEKYASLCYWVHEFENSKELAEFIEKQKEAERLAEIKAIEEAKEKLIQFRAFKVSSLWGLGKYFLRYNKETEQVETSGGVKMSKDLFLSAYNRLKNNTLQVGQHVDKYTFNGVLNGVLSIGCHKIDINEVENVMLELG